MFQLILLFSLIAKCSIGVGATVGEATELDCSFEFACHWFNGTSGLEDSADWGVAQSVQLGAWNNLPILGLSNSTSTGSCLDDQLRNNKAPKLAFSADCAESQSLTFMATTKPEPDSYAYLAGNSGATAWLVSAELPRQIGAGVLTFSYWKSRNSPSLRVCGRKPPGYPNALDCNWYSTPIEFRGQQWVKDRVIIPPSDSPFEILFVAQAADRNNLIAIDDIQYRASLGTEGSDNLAIVQQSGQAVQAGPTEVRIPRIGEEPGADGPQESSKSKSSSSSNVSKTSNFRVVIDSTKCPLVACDFDENLCKYINVGSAQWRQSKVSVGNRVTGITADQNGDGGFAHASQTGAADASFSISTRPFLTALPGVVGFAYHMSGRTGRFRVCDGSLDNCTVIAENKENSFSAKLLSWQSGEFSVGPGSHQLIFVADRQPQNYVVGLDNVQLWDKTRTFELECFSSN